jgi:hypothetical protein
VSDQTNLVCSRASISKDSTKLAMIPSESCHFIAAIEQLTDEKGSVE